jgi:hypothetical protein
MLCSITHWHGHETSILPPELKTVAMIWALLGFGVSFCHCYAVLGLFWTLNRLMATVGPTGTHNETHGHHGAGDDRSRVRLDERRVCGALRGRIRLVLEIEDRAAVHTDLPHSLIHPESNVKMGTANRASEGVIPFKLRCGRSQSYICSRQSTTPYASK